MIAVFVSGAGTTLENLCLRGLPVATVISNRKEIGSEKIAEKHGIAYHCIPKEGTLEFWSEKLFECAKDCRLTVLAGFDQLLHVPREWENRVINIHPSLLPKFGGKGMHGLNVHKAVLKSREKTTGCTVHYVDEHYDHGRVIDSAVVPVEPNDTPETLQSRVQESERDLYPRIISQILGL